MAPVLTVLWAWENEDEWLLSPNYLLGRHPPVPSSSLPALSSLRVEVLLLCRTLGVTQHPKYTTWILDFGRVLAGVQWPHLCCVCGSYIQLLTSAGYTLCLSTLAALGFMSTELEV